MRLLVNGEARETRSATLAALLEEMRVPRERVACEINLKVVRREAFGVTPLKDGDRVEIVHAIGGGA